MKTCIILNPWAGRGLAGQRRAELEDALRRAEVEFTLLATHARGGATELTFQAIARGAEAVVAVGGDGTINEVVNGIVGSQGRGIGDAALGVVPLGTGSDFVKALDGVEPNDLASAVRRIAAGQTRSIDVGAVTVEAGAQELQRYFINGLGAGIDAQVAAESQKLTNLRGLAVYLVAVLRALASYKAPLFTVRYDDYEVRRRLMFATVANGRCQGGGFWLTPEAQLDDGLLDLCIVNKLRLDQSIRYIPRALEGSHTREAWVTMGRARTVEISALGTIPVATDGEVVATHARRLSVQILPGAVRLLV